MTQPDLDAIRARLAGATRGPWILDDYDEGERAWIVMNSEHGTHQHAVAAVPSIYNRSKAAANAALIAHAPIDIEALLAEVDRLRGVPAALDQAGVLADAGQLRDFLARADEEGWLMFSSLEAQALARTAVDRGLATEARNRYGRFTGVLLTDAGRTFITDGGDQR